MKIIKSKDYDQMSRKAANIISAQVIMKPDCVLGLATGSSPIGTYRQLIDWYNKGDVDFSECYSVNLDEYKGLSGDHDQSYRYFMQKNLFDHIMKHAPVDQKDPETVAADQLCKKMFRLCFHINLFHEKKNSHRIKYHKRRIVK